MMEIGWFLIATIGAIGVVTEVWRIFRVWKRPKWRPPN